MNRLHYFVVYFPSYVYTSRHKSVYFSHKTAVRSGHLLWRDTHVTWPVRHYRARQRRTISAPCWGCCAWGTRAAATTAIPRGDRRGDLSSRRCPRSPQPLTRRWWTPRWTRLGPTLRPVTARVQAWTPQMRTSGHCSEPTGKSTKQKQNNSAAIFERGRIKLMSLNIWKSFRYSRRMLGSFKLEMLHPVMSHFIQHLHIDHEATLQRGGSSNFLTLKINSLYKNLGSFNSRVAGKAFQ